MTNCFGNAINFKNDGEKFYEIALTCGVKRAQEFYGSRRRVALFLMDYANRQRRKIFAGAEVEDTADAPELIEKLRVGNYEVKVERAVNLHVKAFDWNCPQRITPEQIRVMIQPLNEEIKKLEKEPAELNARNL